MLSLLLTLLRPSHAQFDTGQFDSITGDGVLVARVVTTQIGPTTFVEQWEYYTGPLEPDAPWSFVWLSDTAPAVPLLGSTQVEMTVSYGSLPPSSITDALTDTDIDAYTFVVTVPDSADVVAVLHREVRDTAVGTELTDYWVFRDDYESPSANQPVLDVTLAVTQYETTADFFDAQRLELNRSAATVTYTQ